MSLCSASGRWRALLLGSAERPRRNGSRYRVAWEGAALHGVTANYGVRRRDGKGSVQSRRAFGCAQQACLARPGAAVTTQDGAEGHVGGSTPIVHHAHCNSRAPVRALVVGWVHSRMTIVSVATDPFESGMLPHEFRRTVNVVGLAANHSRMTIAGVTTEQFEGWMLQQVDVRH